MNLVRLGSSCMPKPHAEKPVKFQLQSDTIKKFVILQWFPKKNCQTSNMQVSDHGTIWWDIKN